MSEPIEIKKGLFGKTTVHYKCHHCSTDLRSPLSDAGETDSCPECGRTFVVPGIEERETIERRRVAALEAKRKFERQRRQHMLDKEEERRRKNEEGRVRAEVERLRMEEVESQQLSDSQTCPYCGESILKVARKCKHCGEFIDEALRYDQNASKETDTSKAKQQQVEAVSGLVGCLFLFIIMGGCLVWINSDSPSISTDSPDEVAAWVMAQEFVGRQLKAPSTASYGGVFSGDYQDPRDVVTSLGSNEFRIRAWVDSQNSFGAMIRTPFVCELRYLGNDRWRCTRLDIDED